MSRAKVVGHSPASNETATVMLVDDEPTTLLVVESFLRAAGYENLVLVDDSRQALDLVASVRPDVLLLDLIMPHVGGLEILSAMQADAAHSEIPVIILSGGDDEARREVMSLGATDFIAKPVDPKELALRLRETLGSKAPSPESA
jgi:PleD family two-component response regulator